jgi:hypothetical protein
MSNVVVYFVELLKLKRMASKHVIEFNAIATSFEDDNR